MIYREHLRLARIYLQIRFSKLSSITGLSESSLKVIEKGYGEIINSKIKTITTLRKTFEERGIVFLISDEGTPFIKYDPKKDIVGHLKNN